MVAMSIIDRVGRKTLLLIGSVGCTLCLAGVARDLLHGTASGICWSGVWSVSSPSSRSRKARSSGCYISEVFPNRVRAKGQSLGSFTHWIMNAVISCMFPVVAANSRGAPFVFFAAMMALQFFVVLFFYPETKGVSLEEMQRKLGIA